jgi:hypothetical protein
VISQLPTEHSTSCQERDRPILSGISMGSLLIEDKG